MAKDNNTEAVRNMQGRISQLTDRVLVLENQLKRTREMISADIEKLVTAMRQKR
tara:strand:- start:109 stop:270 length:162 start_codon:yes stop_codon:yes gene_type:complete